MITDHVGKTIADIVPLVDKLESRCYGYVIHFTDTTLITLVTNTGNIIFTEHSVLPND